MHRLRQIAFAARDLAAAEAALGHALGLERCYQDPGVAVFGLANALFRVGDQFLEVVSPVQEGTAAGRLLDARGGDCGYMAIVQVDDLGPVQARLSERGIRVVFDAATDEIRGLHLHPKDVPGAIVSVDAAREPAEWPWAGPRWRDHADAGVASAIRGMTVAVPDPAAAAEIWAAVLGLPADGDTIALDDATVRFRSVEPGGRQGITGLVLATPVPDRAGDAFDLLGTTIELTAA